METTRDDGRLPVLTPTRFPRVAREVVSGRTVVAIGDGDHAVRVGERELAIIAGPCAVEGLGMIRETAVAVRAAGASALRGGAFKPRTPPYAFQGPGAAGLEILAEARAATGLPIVTEVVDTRDVERVAEIADVLQVGARNMHNAPLLSEVGRSGRPVLLKRGFAARIDELLFAAEYVMAAGKGNVILCERGIRTFETATRNTFDVAAVPLLKAETHLPVIVDPSHAAGRSALVAPLAMAAIAAGADGLLIEVHPDPANATSDGDQSITPADFAALVRTLRHYADAAGRTLPEPPAAGEDALDALRARIAETDRAIVELARRRVELALLAGEAKRTLGRPVVDPPREREVERMMLDRARELGLAAHEAHIQSIARALIALARAAQSGQEDDR